MELLKLAQIIIAVLLIVAVILQNRGSGLSGVFGNAGSNVYSTKRGLEKKLFYATIVLTAAFFVVSIAIVSL